MADFVSLRKECRFEVGEKSGFVEFEFPIKHWGGAV